MNGARLRTESNIIYGGARLRVQTDHEIMNGARLVTHAQSPTTNYLYTYLPSVEDWNTADTYAPIAPSTPYYTPFNRPDVEVSFTLSYTSTNTVFDSRDTTFPDGHAPTGDTVTTKTVVGGTTTTVTKIGGVVTNTTTTTSGSTGASGVTDLTPWLKTLSLDMPLGGKYSFNATFHQYPSNNSYLNKEKEEFNLTDQHQPDSLLSTFPSDFDILRYGSNSLNPKIVHHKFDTSRLIFISISVGIGPEKQTWTSPPFAPGSPSFDGYELHWSGEDISVILEQEYQTMNDILPTGVITGYSSIQNTRNAVDTINAIATQYQLDKVLSPQFPDYPIRLLRRAKGRPIDWIDKICKPYQAVRLWQGGKLVLRPIQDPQLASAKYKITNSMITEGSLSETYNPNFKNVFTIARVQDNGGYYGSQQCTGGHCIGRTVNIQFQAPLTNVSLVLNALGPADLRDFVFFNGDKIVGGGPGTATNFNFAIPATSMKGTYQLGGDLNTGNITQTAGFTQSSPYASQDYGYSIYVKGGVTSGLNFSTHFVFHLQDNPSISIFGVKPEVDVIEDEIIPNIIVAQAYIKAILLFNVRKIWRMELSTVFINPLILPGDCVSCTDYLTQQNDVNWTVEKVSLAMEEGGEWTQKLELSRGLLLS